MLIFIDELETAVKRYADSNTSNVNLYLPDMNNEYDRILHSNTSNVNLYRKTALN